MWIFEWDMVGGWHSLLSIVYHSIRDDVDVAIRQGYEAADTVRRARQRLQAAVDAAGPGACADCGGALRSLEYQETLFDALAAWRETFLSYYRWLDTGDRAAWTRSHEARQRFEIAAARHVDRFGADLEFPAFNLTSARQAAAAAGRAGAARALAAVLLLIVFALLACGSPLARRWRRLERVPWFLRTARLMWTSAATPWLLAGGPIDVSSSVAVTTLTLVLVGVLVGLLTGFTTIRVAANAPLLLAIVAVAFESTAIGAGGRQGRGRLLVAPIGPLLPGLIFLFALIAYLGPIGFWYGFWTSPMVRVAFLTVLLSTPLWTLYVMFAAQTIDSTLGRIGASLAAAGVALLTLTALLPDWMTALRSLDRPLNFAPATDTMLFALHTYVGVNLNIGVPALALGAALIVSGYGLRRLRDRT